MPKKKFTIVFIGWMVLITSLSLFSFSTAGESRIWFPHLDKLVHACFHIGIVVLGALFLKETSLNSWPWRKKVWTLLGFSVAYGCLIELLQWAMPFKRAAELLDVMANLSGALVGCLLIQMGRSLIERLK